MGPWKYRKLESSSIQGVCMKCGVNKQHNKGGGKYRPLCSRCHLIRDDTEEQINKRKENRKATRERNSYRVHKGESCEECGFIPVHSCQLDVDHIDGNHDNNDTDNLKTLCANCHRLKTYINKDWE